MSLNFSGGCTCERLGSFEFLLFLIADFIGEMFWTSFFFFFLLNFGVLLNLELGISSVHQHHFSQSFPWWLSGDHCS